MARVHPSSAQAPFFNLAHANWVVGVLKMLIAVVGRDSLLGLILRQTRSEISSLVREEAPAAPARAAAFRDN